MKSLYGSITRSAVTSLSYVTFSMTPSTSTSIRAEMIVGYNSAGESAFRSPFRFRQWDLRIHCCLRPACPVVGVGDRVTTEDEIERRIVFVHDAHHKDHARMQRVQHLLKFVAGKYDVGFCLLVTTEDIWQFRVPPVRDVVVLRILTQNGLHQFEVVVARHTKDMPTTSFFQPAKQKVSDRLLHDRHLLSDISEDGKRGRELQLVKYLKRGTNFREHRRATGPINSPKHELARSL